MPKPNPTISIVIPNCNHGCYIADAINSLLSQTYPDYEIIVVDDGSTDQSRKIISSFGDKVRAIYQHNQGLSAARNTGIRAAQGSYIGVLDADDMVEPEFMSTLVSLLESQPDADGIYCGFRFVDQLNNPLPQIEARTISPDRLYKTLVEGNFLVPESMFVRKYCYDEVGLFDTSLQALEDFDMWLRITSRFKIVSTTKILTRHRVVTGSMSSDPTRQFQNRLRVIRKHFGAEPVPGGVWSDAQRRAYGRAYLVSAVEYLQAHDEVRAFECVYAMANACPSLLSEMETFYELGCGDQPKGCRGGFSFVNIEQNYRIVMCLLERLFQSAGLQDLRDFKNIAHANARYAFGLLSYGQGKSKAAQMFFFGAIRYQPKFLFDRVVMGSVARSLAGANLIRQLKRLGGRLA